MFIACIWFFHKTWIRKENAVHLYMGVTFPDVGRRCNWMNLLICEYWNHVRVLNVTGMQKLSGISANTSICNCKLLYCFEIIQLKWKHNFILTQILFSSNDNYNSQAISKPQRTELEWCFANRWYGLQISGKQATVIDLDELSTK